MCDTVVYVPEQSGDGPVVVGKNSDREPGESQVVERIAAADHPADAVVHCTHVEIPQAAHTHQVILSRPTWMWGCEMGLNEHGLVVANEAVFTRIPVEKSGLTGMDLQRLALERCTRAEEALDLLIMLLGHHPQGGGCGYRHRSFRYHSAFVLADRSEAWILETAGPYWAARRVRGAATISNCLSIGGDFDRVHDGAYDFARSKGWARSAGDFDFARSFGSGFYRTMAGGEVRRACTLAGLKREQRPTVRGVMSVLRDHGDRAPSAGWRMEVPCAHASWWPTRSGGQSTGSMVVALGEQTMAWLTGTSSPCISVFKPVTFGDDPIGLPPPRADGFDEESLWWRHEVLHRTVLPAYSERRAAFEVERAALEDECLAERSPSAERCRELWARHVELLPAWTEAAGATGRSAGAPMFRSWWRSQSKKDGLPTPLGRSAASAARRRSQLEG